MKIGLISTQFAINYGAVLQAVALKKAIKNAGYDCEIINFRPKNKVDGRNQVYKWNNPKSIAYSALLFLNYKFRKDKKYKIVKFDQFIKKYGDLSTKKYSSYDDLINNLPYYDSFVCGSDQIWNMNLFNDPSFFLKFESIHPKANYVAYAPSITEKLNKAQFQKLASNISHFSSISLREKTGANQLSDFLGYSIKTVLDPVFLLTKEQWIEMEEPLDISEPFILNYGLVGTKKTGALLKAVKEKFKYKLININIDPFNKFNADYNITNLSPGNFIWLIRNAKFICSSSFHGMVFSLVFEKQFLASPADYRNSRHKNVLKITNLEERLVSETSNIDEKLGLHPIDYSRVNETIEKERNDSFTYLRTALNVR